MKRYLFFPLLLLLALGCGVSTTPPAPTAPAGDSEGEASASGPDEPTVVAPASPVPSLGAGTITYTYNDDLFRIAATSGATPENVSRALDLMAPGSDDEFLNIAPDGAWLLLSSDRFDADCAGWPCLALLPADLSAAEVIRAGGEVVHSEGFAAVTSGGDLVVYPAAGGPHDMDLWAVSRTGDGWTDPLLLTGASPYAFQGHPALADDGSRLVFHCGPVAYGLEGTALCEVGVSGADFRVVLTPAEGPGGNAQNALHHPDYAPNGDIVFEADWNGEQIWRLPAGGGAPILVSTTFNNDNSPCALPDGRIASLWLDLAGRNRRP